MATSHADGLIDEVCTHLEPFNATLDLSLYPGEHSQYLSPIISKVDTIKDFNSPIRSATRDYETIILQDILHLHSLPLKLLQLVYRSLENSAEVIIVQKCGAMETSEVEALLEKSEFRAANTIRDLIEGCDVIVAKKMHMWGNGL
ncbi:hypothetical protein [Sulfuricurvum sp.]|uniref:hypothetical protein n=1 Tax=Sulfuricurvum sp. TaxID=2025608 RepID=UPI002E37E4AC|nr:hypothetical protein [Sulfuricurvum sp.]HEX5329351.1 hypothetical protein [Sulfuricurvum sp.]